MEIYPERLKRTAEEMEQCRSHCRWTRESVREIQICLRSIDQESFRLVGNRLEGYLNDMAEEIRELEGMREALRSIADCYERFEDGIIEKGQNTRTAAVFQCIDLEWVRRILNNIVR